jgi:hypothetical protein
MNNDRGLAIGVLNEWDCVTKRDGRVASCVGNARRRKGTPDRMPGGDIVVGAGVAFESFLIV